ncbi:MAG: carboxypeptidase-like regulatory domain-containing protein [Methanomassiliicoccales archaeon]|nr:carboxypeptidase-like regulatory domain-containing protein [Methanomassiliicoccales archaeon]
MRSKRMRGDERAGIEGMPLQLMIIVLVAGVSMAIILGWTSGLSAPQTIASVTSNPNEIEVADGDGDGLFTADSLGVEVYVADSEGKPVEDATVILEGGCALNTDGGTPHATTDSHGVASFSSLTVQKYGSSVGFITVTVVKSNCVSTASLTIPIIAG